jgi:hypothetical protein
LRARILRTWGKQKTENRGQFLAPKMGPVFGPKIGSLMILNRGSKRGPILDPKNKSFCGPHFGVHFWPKGLIFGSHFGVHFWSHRDVFPECGKYVTNL